MGLLLFDDEDVPVVGHDSEEDAMDEPELVDLVVGAVCHGVGAVGVGYEELLLFVEPVEDHEMPHGVAVEIESYKETPKLTRIGAVIYCERKSHKGIIIGKQGKKLKGIGKAARLELEALLGTKVFLELFVKVKENWRDSDFDLANFGYKE